MKHGPGSEIEAAAEMLARSSRTAALTGAGISRESGIPTFRESGGLWDRYRPEELASVDGFLADPSLVWRWYMQRLFSARTHEPNPGHYALATLEEMLPSFVIITQNVDDLHRRAGSTSLIELHGNIEKFRCLESGHPAEYDEEWGEEPPCCHCGSIIRPGVVWFGEALPEREIETAFAEAQACDVMLVVGTSGLVSPASYLPAIAKQAGAGIIEVNRERSAISPLADIFLEGPSGKILPRLVELTAGIGG